MQTNNVSCSFWNFLVIATLLLTAVSYSWRGLSLNLCVDLLDPSFFTISIHTFAGTYIFGGEKLSAFRLSIKVKIAVKNYSIFKFI